LFYIKLRDGLKIYKDGGIFHNNHKKPRIIPDLEGSAFSNAGVFALSVNKNKMLNILFHQNHLLSMQV